MMEELRLPGESLAPAVRRGDMAAFEQIVELFEESLYRYAERLLQNSADAQEVVQDAFLRAHRALTRQYDEERCATLALKPWLLRIVRNLAYNRRRGAAQHLESPLLPLDHNGFERVSLSPAAGHLLEKKEEKALLEDALATLPTESRDLITLRFIEELSYAEIARTTGSSETVLRGRVFRSLRMLRDALAGKGVEHAL